MGLKSWLGAWILKKNIRNIRTATPIEKNVDILLADEMKTMTATNRTIEKLLKVKIMRQETQHTLDKIGELDTERYEETEEEPEEDFEEGIKKMLFAKILGGATTPQQPQDEFGVVPEEVPQATPQPQNPILDAVNNMSPEEMQKLKGKFLG